LLNNTSIAQLKVEEERSPRKLHKNRSKMTLVGRSFGAIRRFTTTAARRGGDGSLDHIPPPGHNLPFDISNRYKLTVSFILFFGSGLAIPYMAVRHQLLKK